MTLLAARVSFVDVVVGGVGIASGAGGMVIPALSWWQALKHLCFTVK